MMRAVPLILILTLCLGCKSSTDSIEVHFSPRGGATDAIVDRLDNARRSIQVQAYSFTSTPIAKALVDAHRRGVEIQVILDSSQRTAKYSSATFLNNQGVPVWIDDAHAIAHNKIIIIDGATLVTGSMNFTKAGEESNAENILIIDDRPQLIEAYQGNFEEHLRHSERYHRS